MLYKRHGRLMVQGLGDLEPVSQETAAGAIANQIRDRVKDGTFSSGERLGESLLASQLEVSRGPVREALQRLIQEGLLVYRRNRGVFVVTLDKDEIVDVYLARGAIEREAAKIVIRQGETESFDRLEEYVKGMSEAAETGEWPRIADCDLRFHEHVVYASRSKRLRKMFGTLLVETRMCLSALEFAYPVHQRLANEHRNILQSMRKGNETEALELLDAHLRDAVKDLTDESERES
jgi:DNA-binding GntR family transcriptional regulator